jgi:hypothetical protein
MWPSDKLSALPKPDSPHAAPVETRRCDQRIDTGLFEAIVGGRWQPKLSIIQQGAFMFIESLESREFMSAATTLTPATESAAPQTSTARSSLVYIGTTTQPQPTPSVIISIIGILVG